MRTNDKGHVVELDPGEIIVVGTNGNGEHYGGAAAQAYQDFDLEWGVFEGLSGRTYAFPTLTKQMRPYGLSMLTRNRNYFYHIARENPQFTFLLTPAGTGIAGIDRVVIEELFKKLPDNVKKVGW